MKLQSIARCNKAMHDLESQGKTTTAMRNRNRRRRALDAPANVVTTEDTPSLLQCCGVGLIL